MIPMVVMAVVSIVGSLFSSSAAAKKNRQIVEQQRLAAKYQYLAKEASTNMMKGVVRENTYNAIGEVLRVSAVNTRNIEKAIKIEGSKSLASSEGLTSGRTKGREMISLYIKGAEAVNNSESQHSNMISQVITQQDEYTNKLNNDLIVAHDKMANILAARGPSTDFVGSAVVAGIGGAAQGYSMGSNSTTTTG